MDPTTFRLKLAASASLALQRSYSGGNIYDNDLGRFILTFTGKSSANNYSHYGRSPNGVSWTKLTTAPVPGADTYWGTGQTYYSGSGDILPQVKTPIAYPNATGSGKFLATPNRSIIYAYYPSSGSSSIPVIRSTDGGTTWTSSTFPAVFGSYDPEIQYANTQFIMVGATDTRFYSSSNGVNWSTNTDAVAVYNSVIAIYGAYYVPFVMKDIVFFAVSSSNNLRVIWSKDTFATNFNTATGTSGNFLNTTTIVSHCVRTSGNNLTNEMVIGTFSGKVYKVTYNGTTVSISAGSTPVFPGASPGTNSYLRNIIWSETLNKYVGVMAEDGIAGGSTSFRNVVTSTDGITWTHVTTVDSTYKRASIYNTHLQVMRDGSIVLLMQNNGHNSVNGDNTTESWVYSGSARVATKYTGTVYNSTIDVDGTNYLLLESNPYFGTNMVHRLTMPSTSILSPTKNYYIQANNMTLTNKNFYYSNDAVTWNLQNITTVNGLTLDAKYNIDSFVNMGNVNLIGVKSYNAANAFVDSGTIMSTDGGNTFNLISGTTKYTRVKTLNHDYHTIIMQPDIETRIGYPNSNRNKIRYTTNRGNTYFDTTINLTSFYDVYANNQPSTFYDLSGAVPVINSAANGVIIDIYDIKYLQPDRAVDFNGKDATRDYGSGFYVSGWISYSNGSVITHGPYLATLNIGTTGSASIGSYNFAGPLSAVAAPIGQSAGSVPPPANNYGAGLGGVITNDILATYGVPRSPIPEASTDTDYMGFNRDGDMLLFYCKAWHPSIYANTVSTLWKLQRQDSGFGGSSWGYGWDSVGDSVVGPYTLGDYGMPRFIPALGKFFSYHANGNAVALSGSYTANTLNYNSYQLTDFTGYFNPLNL
jgi:hypothetical protein